MDVLGWLRDGGLNVCVCAARPRGDSFIVNDVSRKTRAAGSATIPATPAATGHNTNVFRDTATFSRRDVSDREGQMPTRIDVFSGLRPLEDATVTTGHFVCSFGQVKDVAVVVRVVCG